MKSSIICVAEFIRQHLDSPEAENQAWAVVKGGTQTLTLLSCGHPAILGGLERFYFSCCTLREQETKFWTWAMWEVESENTVQSQRSCRLCSQRNRKRRGVGGNKFLKAEYMLEDLLFYYWALGRGTKESPLRTFGHRPAFLEFWVPSLSGWKCPSKNLNEKGAMFVA